MNQHNMNNINHLVALADKAADMSPDAKGAESRLLEVIAAQQRRIEALENVLASIERNAPTSEPQQGHISNYPHAHGFWQVGHMVRRILKGKE